jgi:hypothetical protein
VGQGLSDQRRDHLLEKLRLAGIKDRKVPDAQGKMVVVSERVRAHVDRTVVISGCTEENLW